MAEPFKTYEARAPHAQNAVDALDGWVGSLPDEYAVRAGEACFFNDMRVAYAADQFGSLEGKSVLELGPLEGAHSWTLAQRGAAVDAVEANKTAYLRCLVTKEITGLANVRFHLGDAVKWLEDNSRRYDLVFACGVLYHMPDPVRLLRAIAARTDAVYLWTHYVDFDGFSAGDKRRADWGATLERQDVGGETIRTFRRGYLKANEAATFCGGAFDDHRWMDRGDILKVLALLGFGTIAVAHDDHSSPFGSSFSVFARRD